MTALNPQQQGYKAHSIQRGETFSVSHAVLVAKPGFNRRRKFAHIPELADRIRTNGFRKSTPLVVEWNKELGVFHVIHGERRLRAVKLLVEQGHEPGPIWCMSESRDTTLLQQLVDQVLTNTGEQFTPLEKGFVYLDIQAAEPGITGTQIAERMGETKQAVSDALRLAKHGSNTLHAAVEDDRISSTTAGDIIKQAGEDHAAQDALLEETLRAASDSGSSHATPKHLPKAPAKASRIEAEWEGEESEHEWNDEDVCTTPSILTALGAKWGIREIEISYATRNGKWHAAFTFTAKDGTGGGGRPSSARDDGFPTADDAILHQWTRLHSQLVTYATGHKQESKILAYLDALGTKLQVIYTASSSSSAQSAVEDSSNVIIPDPNDDEDESPDSSTPFAGSDAPADSSRHSAAPPDPGAYDRLKNSPSASEGISNSDSFGKGGDPKIDGRIRKVNDLLEELNKDNCDTTRWDTIELLLTYLDGKGTIAVVKKHLTDR